MTGQVAGQLLGAPGEIADGEEQQPGLDEQVKLGKFL